MTRSLSAVALFCLGLPLVASPPTALAQELAAATGATREDSIRVHRSARSRQAAFERTRRHHLPWAWGGGSGECDERIGRFCLTYSDGDDAEWERPDEDEAVVRARTRLLEELADAAATVPGDRWVVGHRVRYLVEAARFDEARRAARSCRAEEWWCQALLGFAAHHSGDAAAADSAFSRMLEEMPEEERREWTDLTVILDSGMQRRYRRLAGAERAQFEQRFWSLADPLLQTPGNDLRSEHLSRHLLVALQDRAETTEDLSWGNDLREILLRFGPPSGWERIRRPYQLHTQEVSLVSHYPDSDIDLLPPRELLDGDFDPTAGEWDRADARARASYPLPRRGERLRWITPFDHQVAVFRGVDSALVIAAYEFPEDSIPAGTRIDAALAVRAGIDDEAMIERREGAGPRGVLTVAVPSTPLLVSVEVVAAAARRAARARFGLDLAPLVPGVLASSDLLVLKVDGDSVPETRSEAIERARESLRVQAGERVGVYWELYSPAAPWPESMEVSVRLVDADAGWLRRMAERAGIVRQVQPIRLVWGESPDGGETLPRSLALQIPEDVASGAYTLEIAISATGREPLVTRRLLQVVP